jgi:phosphoribosylanthranilate isomerase
VNIRVKICGITKPDQGQAIAQLGAHALGFICVAQSPRYVLPEQIRAIVKQLPINPVTGQSVDRVGVFANASISEIYQTVTLAELNGVQLHGNESPQFCHQLQFALPQVEIIKALRIRTLEALSQIKLYEGCINTLLLDAYHPNVLGGTGRTLNWSALQNFRPGFPWFLAGGLTPDNILDALAQAQPNGIDLSSGLERAPGDKDLLRVQQLFQQLAPLHK